MTKRKLGEDAGGTPREVPTQHADKDSTLEDEDNVPEGSDIPMNISVNMSYSGTESGDMPGNSVISMPTQPDIGNNVINPQQAQELNVLNVNFRSRLNPIAYKRLVEEIYLCKPEATSLEEYFENPQAFRAEPTWLFDDFYIEEETLLTYFIKKEAEHVVDAIWSTGLI